MLKRIGAIAAGVVAVACCATTVSAGSARIQPGSAEPTLTPLTQTVASGSDFDVTISGCDGGAFYPYITWNGDAVLTAQEGCTTYTFQAPDSPGTYYGTVILFQTPPALQGLRRPHIASAGLVAEAPECVSPCVLFSATVEAPPTTTVPATTTTEAPTTTSAPTTTAASSLPATGSGDNDTVALIAAALLIVGGALIATSRRRGAIID